MSGQSIVLNSVPNNPTLSDLLDLMKKEIMLGLNCHHIGTVQSFDSTTMTVQATINYTKTFFELNTVTGVYSPVQVNYPIVVAAPIICLSGGTSFLAMPITKGDECLLLFNDRDMDNWFATGQVGPVASSRLHSFTDAFALVGVKSTPNVFTKYDPTRALISNGTVSVGINPANGKATIKNASTTLNGILQNILTQLENLCAACAAITVTGVLSGGAASGPPANAATITAISTQLSTLATQLGGLIE